MIFGHGHDGEGMISHKYFLAFLRHKIKSGTKQNVLADAIGVGEGYLSKVKNEKKNCSQGLREAVAEYFGISFQEMLAMGQRLHEGIPEDEEPENREAIVPGKGFKERRQMMMAAQPTPVGLSESELLANLAQTFANHRQCLSEVAKWRTIIESLGEPVVVINRAMNVEFQNLAHQSLTGGEYIGKNCTASFESSGLCSCDHKCPVQRAFVDGFVHRDIMPMGDKTVSVTASPIRDGSGIITAVVVIIKDVTERQRIIDELSAVRGSHQALFDNLDYPVAIINKDDVMVYANQMFFTITGADPAATFTHDTLVLLFRKIVKNFDAVYVRVKKVVNKESRREQIPCELLHHDISGVLDIESLFTIEGEYIGRINRFRINQIGA